MTIASTITTADQLMKSGDIGRCELVRGELVMMTPAGYPHGKLAYRIAKLIGDHIDANHLGDVLGAETGFLIRRSPDTVRAPDVAFVRAARARSAPLQGFFDGPPDLAVEVLSPNDSAGEVLDKVHQWLEAGAIAVWIVDPARRTVGVHRIDQPVCVLGESDILIDQDLLPGFRLAISQVFA